MDNNEAKNTNAVNVDGLNKSAVDFAYLEGLLNNQKERIRDYEKVKTDVKNLIISESNDPDKFKAFVKLLLEGEIPIVRGFFEQEFQHLSPENKNFAIGELLALPADKAVTRQAAVAQQIAVKEGEIAAKIIFHIISGSKGKSFEYQEAAISREKKEALRTRFFPENGTWISLDSSDEKIFHTLISFFVELTDEIKDFGKSPYIGVAHQFSRWVINSLPRTNFDNDQLSKIESRLSKIINRLPPQAQEELKQLKDKSYQEPLFKDEPLKEESNAVEPGAIKTNEIISEEKLAVTDIAQEKAVIEPEKNSTNEKKSTSENNLIESDVSLPSHANHLRKTKSPEPAHKKNTPRIFEMSAPEQLLKEKQAALAQLSSEIEVLSKLIQERDSLLKNQKDLQERLASAYEETEEAEEKLRKLRQNFDETETTLSQTIGQRDKALNTNKQLNEELSRVKRELEQKNTSLESERSEFAQSSKQEVEFEIENFKGSLTQKLRPILENKRRTDSDPINEKLAEFLRRWFTQIEEVLKKSGINP